MMRFNSQAVKQFTDTFRTSQAAERDVLSKHELLKTHTKDKNPFLCRLYLNLSLNISFVFLSKSKCNYFTPNLYWWCSDQDRYIDSVISDPKWKHQFTSPPALRYAFILKCHSLCQWVSFLNFVLIQNKRLFEITLPVRLSACWWWRTAANKASAVQ